MQKLVFVSLVLVSAIGVLVWVGVEAASIPVARIADLKGGAHGEDQEVRIDDGKVVAIESFSPLTFSVASEKDPANVLLVSSRRSMPENFKVGSSVGLRGTYQRDKNLFDAYQVSTQCPSKYEASKEAEKQAAASTSGYGALPLSQPPDPRGAVEAPAPSKVAN